MDTYTIALRDLRRDDVAAAGAKGANLGGLIQAGFRVPPGFVVTTTAYRDFLSSAGLEACAPAETYERIPKAVVPDPIVKALLAAFRDLGAHAVAVRSSGTAEDLADASFAGQYDTFLDVAGEQALIDAVRRCWASLWTPRAVAYRRRREWSADVSLAVVVQEMVDAEWAGVLFTADPVTGRRDRIVVEAVRGLGDKLVSGEATGVRYVVSKDSGARGPSDPLDSGLPPRLVEELVRSAREAERHFGGPQDLEWAYAKGECALLQARPMTALPDEPTGPAQPADPEPVAVPDRDAAALPPAPARRGRGRSKGLTRRAAMAADHVPFPPYPMDNSLTVRPVLRGLVRMMRSAGIAAPPAEDLLTEVADGVLQIRPPAMRFTPWAVVRLPASLPRLVAAIRTQPERWMAHYRATLLPMLERVEQVDLSTWSDDALLNHVEEIQRAQGRLVPSRFGVAVPRVLADRVVGVLLSLALAPTRARASHADLMSDIPSVTRTVNDELDRLAATVEATPELAEIYDREEPDAIPDRLARTQVGTAFLDEVSGFLRHYGYRQPTMSMAGFPTMGETPAVVHRLLKALAGRKRFEEGTGRDRFVAAREDLRGERSARARALVPLILAMTRTARTGTSFREDSHSFLFMRPAAAQRRLLLELGKRLVDRGTLASATDIFFLEIDEVRQGAESAREVVERRRSARESALPTYRVLPDPEPSGPKDGARTIRGVPASPGTVVGTVRIIRDEEGFGDLAAGEVLVCAFTNPAWTPLFALAGAVVTDAGGAASHAAIVAREYGIPAVMGTGTATRLLRDGERVSVDGTRGTVTPLPGTMGLPERG